MSQDKKQADTPYDVVVVGGGAAGMMAAGTAAGRGCRTLLVEKNPRLGRKLLITGKASRDCYLERWAFDACAPMFEEVFGISPEMHIKSFSAL